MQTPIVPISPPSPTRLLNNSRFYVLSLTVCVSLLVLFVSHITIVDPRLRGIRMQQIFGLLAASYWYATLLMSASSKLIGNKSWMPALLFTRRSLGVSVTYFVLIHFYIAFTQQLGGWSGIWLQTTILRWALVFAAITLVVLITMTLLSVDKIVRFLKFRQWKTLSRISYGAAALILLHIWMIGSHVASVYLQVVIYQALILLFAVEAWRLGKVWDAKGMKLWKVVGLSVGVWLVLSGSLLAVKFYVPSYSQTHNHGTAPGGVKHGH